LYGSNTELLEVELGPVRRGETVEVVFAMNCWLASDLYSLSSAVHSREGISFDWLDGVLYFRVMSAVAMEGVANLNASATTRRLGLRSAYRERAADQVS
jgi:hypothetical protein